MTTIIRLDDYPGHHGTSPLTLLGILGVDPQEVGAKLEEWHRTQPTQSSLYNLKKLAYVFGISRTRADPDLPQGAARLAGGGYLMPDPDSTGTILVLETEHESEEPNQNVRAQVRVFLSDSVSETTHGPRASRIWPTGAEIVFGEQIVRTFVFPYNKEYDLQLNNRIIADAFSEMHAALYSHERMQDLVCRPTNAITLFPRTS
jgi:hypothetical protein